MLWEGKDKRIHSPLDRLLTYIAMRPSAAPDGIPWQNPLPQVVKEGYSTRISCCRISRRLGVHDHTIRFLEARRLSAIFLKLTMPPQRLLAMPDCFVRHFAVLLV